MVLAHKKSSDGLNKSRFTGAKKVLATIQEYILVKPNFAMSDTRSQNKVWLISHAEQGVRTSLCMYKDFDITLSNLNGFSSFFYSFACLMIAHYDYSLSASSYYMLIVMYIFLSSTKKKTIIASWFFIFWKLFLRFRFLETDRIRSVVIFTI